MEDAIKWFLETLSILEFLNDEKRDFLEEFSEVETAQSGNFGMPYDVSTQFSRYPFNHVFESESGHLREYDDTFNQERIHEYHKAGTFYEVDSGGNKIIHVVGDNYEFIAGSDYVNVKGDVNLTIDSNCNTYVKGNWNIQVDGNVVENIKGTYDQNVTGNATMDAATINLNSGTKGAARLDDTVDTGDDPAGISGSDGSNKIETASKTVIIGD